MSLYSEHSWSVIQGRTIYIKKKAVSGDVSQKLKSVTKIEKKKKGKIGAIHDPQSIFKNLTLITT